MATYSGHIPVLGSEAVAALQPFDGGSYVDATFGAGGYARMMLANATIKLLAFDRDPTAIARAASWAKGYAGRLTLVNEPFDRMYETLHTMNIREVHGIVFDLGVSSWQIDEADRGFSFQSDGPLNMRMDQGSLETTGPNAAEIIHLAEEEDLVQIFSAYGEEKRSRTIARAIIKYQDATPITTTGELANIIRQAVGQRAHEKIHPATRVFQAIRIFVNDELGQLVRALGQAESLLMPTGRLCVVTFHSLEDRIVKRFFARRSGHAPGTSRHMPAVHSAGQEATFKRLSHKATQPTQKEMDDNPRARSARLRVGIRTNEPSRPISEPLAKELGLPQLCLSKKLLHSIKT